MVKNSKKSKGAAAARGKARKATPHVRARRAKRVAKKQARRAAPTMSVQDEQRQRLQDALDAAPGGAQGAVAEPPDTDSGLEPSEKKEILNALDADADEYDDDDDTMQDEA